MEARLGQAARRIRLEAGLDLIDLATTSGVSQSTISRFEQGEGWRRDTNAIVDAYAQACGLRPEDLWRAALEADD